MNLKTLISTTALAISANTFAVDLASKNTDSYQHIRNATGRLNYAGKTFLIDPMLAEKGRYAGWLYFELAGNPTYGAVVAKEKVLEFFTGYVLV